MDSDKYCYEVMWQWFFSHFIKHLFPLYLGKFLRPPRQPAEWMEHSSWVGLQVSWLTCKWKLTRSQYATQSGCTGEHGGQMFAETAPHRSRAGAFMGLGDTQLFLSKHISICTCPALWLVHLCTWCFGLHLAGYCAQILIFFSHNTLKMMMLLSSKVMCQLLGYSVQVCRLGCRSQGPVKGLWQRSRALCFWLAWRWKWTQIRRWTHVSQKGLDLVGPFSVLSQLHTLKSGLEEWLICCERLCSSLCKMQKHIEEFSLTACSHMGNKSGVISKRVQVTASAWASGISVIE